MEDENGIELSLGLSCGGSSGKSKLKDVSSDSKVEEESSNKLTAGNISDVSFKHFFQTSIESQDHNGQQRGDPVLHQRENLWPDLGNGAAPVVDGPNDARGSASHFARYQDQWVSNNKTIDTEEENSGFNKRKLPFEETNLQKKHEKGVDNVDTRGKSPTGVTLLKSSHISITTEDGSCGENEDVAESEAEGSTSWLVSHHEDNARCPDIPKFTDKRVLTDPSGIGSQGQKQPSVSGSESNFDHGKVAYGIPLSLQPLTVMTVPYPVPVRVSNASSASSASGYPPSCVMQLMPLADSERPMMQAVNPSNLQLAFGYSAVQLPTLETDTSWAFGSQPQHISSSTSRSRGDGVPNSQHSEEDRKISHVVVRLPRSSSAASAYEGKSSDLVKGGDKHVEEAGASSSSQTEEEVKGNNTIFRPKEILNQPVVEGFPREGSAIRPGVAPNVVKFGGCGSFPDLPWVSTTGPGPNGRTISGVTYKDKNQIKIVCACHGTHMSPEEFVQHASADALNTENNPGLASCHSSNPAASAQS